MTTTDPAAPARALIDVDPRTLLVDLNIRDLKPDKGLVDSVRDIGVLQPVIAYRTLDDTLRVRYGHRRTLAAIEADQPTVPVIVAASEADGDDVDRILGQYAENKHREGLTTADEAHVVAQLLDLGLTAGQVQKRTRMPKAAIAAAKTVSSSPVAAQTAAANPELTLDQAAAIAEFDHDPVAVSALVYAAHHGAGLFKHRVQDLREQEARHQAHAAAAALLSATGITIVTSQPTYENRVTFLTDQGGQELTVEGHKDCPGHVAFLVQDWDDDGAEEWQPRYYCADPAANGHVIRGNPRASTGPVDLDAQKAERSRVLKGNKAWRNAEKVRREWLTEFLTRKEAPKNALRYVIEAITPVYCDFHRSSTSAHDIAREVLGIETSIAEAVSIARVSDGRALVITLGLVLASTEAEALVGVWRTTTQASHIGRYFKALVGWGYTLSEIEQAVADGKPWTPSEAS